MASLQAAWVAWHDSAPQLGTVQTHMYASTPASSPHVIRLEHGVSKCWTASAARPGAAQHLKARFSACSLRGEWPWVRCGAA